LYDYKGYDDKVYIRKVKRFKKLWKSLRGAVFMSTGKRNPWRAMALVSIISSYVVGGVVAGVFTGLWLGNQFGAKPVFLIVSILIGLGVGFYGVMKTIEPFLGDDE
jgi:ATP synthase protein I